ncbi:MAG: hypothetical protein A2381_01995 [Bdellovibrionales bacterium RIFOXYB1_FULL_37_110]|nr:MAG: hypothetical protein A2417_13300 [Bdellovibrionales bacterium RIFOXYC1_FULL_37_79]OFZ59211.1 MAG: hypothetical protein A2381_01995 [Bdellovibrionales bacterium RIFOXYB1_FULL_37_110]OFZ62837.1 MAG: hypothetical protein A2577_10950 [Bdellovibrionales bacterium RIFOXYD1_FULL_36_51]
MGKLFAIGDIHGCNKELELLLTRLPFKDSDTILFLGDYIDRGKDSKGVVNTILNLAKKYNVITLMGNHEQMFLDFFYDKNTLEAGAFLFNGGTTTLSSYCSELGNFEFPKNHLDFFNNLKLFHETDDYFFVHAGLPELPLEEIKQRPLIFLEQFLWVREDFLKSNYQWNKTIIHGHTPILDATLDNQKINLDTGCVYDGKLSAIELPEKILYSVPKINEEATGPEIPGRRRSVRYSIVLPITIDLGEGQAFFETINFSDHGMLIYTITSIELAFTANQIIRGIIGSTKSQAYFTGRIKRVEKKATGSFLAIEFIQRPACINPI